MHAGDAAGRCQNSPPVYQDPCSFMTVVSSVMPNSALPASIASNCCHTACGGPNHKVSMSTYSACRQQTSRRVGSCIHGAQALDRWGAKETAACQQRCEWDHTPGPFHGRPGGRASTAAALSRARRAPPPAARAGARGSARWQTWGGLPRSQPRPTKRGCARPAAPPAAPGLLTG